MKSSYKIVAGMVGCVALGALAVQGLHAQVKPPVYLVALIDVSDVDAYMKEYVPKVRPTIKASGGRQLAASQLTPIQGDPPKSRVSITVWDSLEQLEAWRNSPEYKDSLMIGEKYAKFTSFAVEGLPQ